MIIPLEDRILVQPDPIEEKIGSIYIPQTSQQAPIRGTVLDVGQGKEGVKMEVKTGDKVLYSKGAGTTIEHEGETLLILYHRELHAICD